MHTKQPSDYSSPESFRCFLQEPMPEGDFFAVGDPQTDWTSLAHRSFFCSPEHVREAMCFDGGSPLSTLRSELPDSTQFFVDEPLLWLSSASGLLSSWLSDTGSETALVEAGVRKKGSNPRAEVRVRRYWTGETIALPDVYRCKNKIGKRCFELIDLSRKRLRASLADHGVQFSLN